MIGIKKGYLLNISKVKPNNLICDKPIDISYVYCKTPKSNMKNMYSGTIYQDIRLNWCLYIYHNNNLIRIADVNTYKLKEINDEIHMKLYFRKHTLIKPPDYETEYTIKLLIHKELSDPYIIKSYMSKEDYDSKYMLPKITYKYPYNYNTVMSIWNNNDKVSFNKLLLEGGDNIEPDERNLLYHLVFNHSANRNLSNSIKICLLTKLYDPFNRDKYGKNIMDFATEYKKDDIFKIIMDYIY